MDVMFATRFGAACGAIRLSDFVQINKNGKIAMKLDEGDSIVGVALCSAEDDVLLTTAVGRCIRFPVDDVRVFAGRESTGVRGIRLADGDSVISMAILRAVAASPAEREAYLKHANAMRAAASAEGVEPDDATPAAPAGGRRGGRARRPGQPQPGADRRAGRGGGVRADRLLRRLWQAHLGL